MFHRCVLLLLLLLLAGQALARSFEHILHRWQNPSSTDIFVVAHRAAFMENRQIILPENSLPAIQYAIALGVDMVELDIRASRDGHFVLIHDATVDRTTNGSGEVAALTLAQLKKLRLIDAVSGAPSKHPVPTLEEVYAAVKGRIMVNLDPKLAVSELGRALQIAADMGVAGQVVLKGTADTPEQLAGIETMLATLPFAAGFMPMHWDKNLSDLSAVAASFAALRPQAAEMVVNISRGPGKRLIEDGGLLFSAQARALARRYDLHLWINTLYIDPLSYPSNRMDRLMWNGGRHDVLGLTYPERVFGFWVEQGASVIQTDEPKFLLDYLARKGLRDEGK